MKLLFIALVVIAGIVVTATFYIEGSGWTPRSATLQLMIWNETNQKIINASNLIWIVLPSMFNITSLPTDFTPNATITYYYYAREVSIAIRYLSPRSALTLPVVSISIPQNLSADLSADEIELWITRPPSGVACSALLQVWGVTPFGVKSLGSSYAQQVTGADIYSGYYTDRYNVHLLYIFLCVLTFIFLASVALAISRTEVEGILPFTTLLVAWFAVFLYVFIGSSSEISAASGIWSLSLLLAPYVFLLVLLAYTLNFIYGKSMYRSMGEPRSHGLRHIVYRGLITVGKAAVITALALESLRTEIHGSYYHITSNLASFLIIGCAIEWIANTGIANSERNPMRFLVFFGVPLIVSPAILALLGLGGVGLSLAIEVMALFFWAYVVVNREIVAKSRYKMVAVYGSGLALAVFYGWFTELLTGLATGFDFQEANVHVWTTIVVIVLLLVFWGASIKGKYKRRIKKAFNAIFENHVATDDPSTT